MLTEHGVTIEGYPNYEITNRGRVFNTKTGREMVLSPTMNGDLTVGLTRGGYQHRYSVKGLVARAFVEGETKLFDTPVLLDCDKHNLEASNIVWRPRWFAWKYTHQFNHRHNWFFFGPLVDLDTLEEYQNYIQAAMVNGILCADIMASIYNERMVFPTHQRFAYLA